MLFDLQIRVPAVNGDPYVTFRRWVKYLGRTWGIKVINYRPTLPDDGSPDPYEATESGLVRTCPHCGSPTPIPEDHLQPEVAEDAGPVPAPQSGL